MENHHHINLKSNSLFIKNEIYKMIHAYFPHKLLK